MKLNYIFMVLIMVLIAPLAKSQQAEQSSLYMYNALYYNPAYAGSRNTISATVLAREQWVGMDGAPSSQFVSFHAPIKDQKLGLGVHFNNDRLGSREKTTAYLDASGSIRLNNKNDRINIGLSAGIDNYTFGFSDLYAVDVNDPIASANMTSLKVNVGAGIYYFGDKHYVGFSVPSIVEHKGDFNDVESNITKRHYFLTAGYVFNLNSVIDFKPSTLVKVTPNAPLVFDINANFLAYKKFWAGAMYRYDEGVGINLAVIIKDMFTVGYAYDYPINKLRTHQGGSHEVMLQFDFSKYKKQGKTYSPRYF